MSEHYTPERLRRMREIRLRDALSYRHIAKITSGPNRSFARTMKLFALNDAGNIRFQINQSKEIML